MALTEEDREWISELIKTLEVRLVNRLFDTEQMLKTQIRILHERIDQLTKDNKMVH